MPTTTSKPTDWSAPHLEAVAAEQPLIDPSIIRRGGAAYVCRSPHGGRKRIEKPETGAPMRTTGDVAAFGPYRVLQLFFRGRWYVIPSHEELMRWTFGGIVETPDGREVEPDDRDSWLYLLDLI